MMKNIVWIVTVIVAALVHTTWPDILKLQGVAPDIALLLVVYLAIAEGEERAMFTGVIAGAYQDVASDTVLGQHVLCLVIIGYVAGRVSTRLITEHPAVKAGLVLFAALIHGMLYTFIAYVQNPANSVLYPFLSSVIPGAFYTALITPLAFLVFTWVLQREEVARGGVA